MDLVREAYDELRKLYKFFPIEFGIQCTPTSTVLNFEGVGFITRREWSGECKILYTVELRNKHNGIIYDSYRLREFLSRLETMIDPSTTTFEVTTVDIFAS